MARSGLHRENRQEPSHQDPRTQGAWQTRRTGQVSHRQACSCVGSPHQLEQRTTQRPHQELAPQEDPRGHQTQRHLAPATHTQDHFHLPRAVASPIPETQLVHHQACMHATSETNKRLF